VSEVLVGSTRLYTLRRVVEELELYNGRFWKS
jgi:hypothetical protein